MVNGILLNLSLACGKIILGQRATSLESIVVSGFSLQDKISPVALFSHILINNVNLHCEVSWNYYLKI